MEAWSEVGPASNLNLNGTKKKEKRRKKITFFLPILGNFGLWAWVKERKERNSFFSLRSTEIGWSEFVEPRFKVHILDEGYTWVPTTRNFVEDFLFGEEELERKASPSL